MVLAKADFSGYKYASAGLNSSHDYLLPKVSELLSEQLKLDGRQRIFELGCGNGSVGNYLHTLGWDVTGVDSSTEGVALAQSAYPNVKLEQGSAYDDLPRKYGQFPVVLSLEVVEHLYAPRIFARNLYEMLESGGSAIVSTPYHGYWKNLVLAVSGKMDSHFTALWDHGHIKFWSQKTLTALLEEVGFVGIEFHRVGRIPMLAKSMIAVAHKP